MDCREKEDKGGQSIKQFPETINEWIWENWDGILVTANKRAAVFRYFGLKSH